MTEMPPPPPPSLTASLFAMPLGAIARSAREAIVVIDSQQHIVAMNPAAQRLFQYDSAQALGQPLTILIPPASRAIHGDLVRRFQASGALERPMDKHAVVTGLRADGQEFPAEAAISRMELVVDGRPREYFVALLRDLSRERALHEELEALTQRFRTVLDMSPMAMWITDGEQVAFANRAAFELFGVREGDQLAGRSVYSLLGAASHDAVRAQLSRAAAGGKAPVVAGTIARLDGGTRDVEIASAGLPDHGRSVVQMVITDITQRESQSREQARHREELRSLSASVVQAREEERRRIARELHDELGQRLTALKMELSSLSPATARKNHDSRVAGMLAMIDDTVGAVRRIASDLRPMMIDDLGLNAAIEWLARDAARRLDIEVTVRMDDEDPPVAEGTAIALYRIVQEALTNVARHARATDVAIEMRRLGCELVLTVRDNGIGFPSAERRPSGRHGLLGIRERAYMLGGRLEVDNPPGGGGRLTVRVPLVPADGLAAAAAGDATP